MISNERSWPGRPKPYHQPYAQPPYAQKQPRPFVQEDTLKTVEIQIERKFFVFVLKRNPRGSFVRISEEGGGRRNTIIIPATGLAEFKRLLEEMMHAADESAAQSEPPPP